MRLSELQSKDVVNVIDGRKLGRIIDVTVDSGKILNFVVEPKRLFSFFKAKDEVSVKWDNIEKIGEDVILIKMNN